jgi:C4-dicarboxylate-specific signal transduction histidine kinase
MLAPLAALLTLMILFAVFYNINHKQNVVLESLLSEQQQTSHKYTFLAHKLSLNHADIFLLLKEAKNIDDEGEFYDKGRTLLLNIHNIELEYSTSDLGNIQNKRIHEKLEKYLTVTSNVILVASVNLKLANARMIDSVSAFNQLNSLLLALSESAQMSIQNKIVSKKDELKEDAIISVSLALLLMLVSTSVTMVLSTLLSKKLNYSINYLRKMLIQDDSSSSLKHDYTDEIKTLSCVSEEVKNTVDKLESEIDNRKIAEYAVTELNHNLEQNVESRTKELQKSNDELKNTLQELQSTQKKLIENDKMASLGKLVAGIAHELNTPIGNALTSISFIEHKISSLVNDLQSNQLKKSLLKSDLDEMKEASSISLLSIERAAEQIKSFKLVAVDTTVDDIREINLRTYIEDIVRSLSPQIKKAGHEVNFLGCEDAVVKSYPGAYVQIFTNLIQNSFIHGFENKNNGSINIEVIDEPEQVKIFYSDNGKGVTEEVRQSIFEPFFTTNRKGGGSGLGAHIIYNLVNQKLKGQITVLEDTPDSGLSYYIQIPKPKYYNSVEVIEDVKH